MSIFETYKKFAKKLPPASLKPVVRLDPKLAGPKILPFNEKPRVIGIIGSPVIGTAKSKEQKKEEKQMKEVYDKVIKSWIKLSMVSKTYILFLYKR